MSSIKHVLVGILKSIIFTYHMQCQCPLSEYSWTLPNLERNNYLYQVHSQCSQGCPSKYRLFLFQTLNLGILLLDWIKKWNNTYIHLPLCLCFNLGYAVLLIKVLVLVFCKILSVFLCLFMLPCYNTCLKSAFFN